MSPKLDKSEFSAETRIVVALEDAEEHLRSIRGMMKFIVTVFLISIIFTACSALF